MPDDVMTALDDRVYGCDICQDVCPWNRGVERRRAEVPAGEGAQPVVPLADWLTRDGAELVDELDRLFVPRNDARWLRRNALVALGNVGRGADAGLAEAYVDDPDPAVRAAAARATALIAARDR
jgi:epoxyqueuosine reductase